MEHINTLFGNRLSFIKDFRFPTGKNSMTNIDGVFTVSMICLGILGCLSVLYLQASPTSVPDHSQILTGSTPGPQGTSQTTALFISDEEDKKSNQYVHIAGSKKAGKPISFVIDTFEKDAQYTFDFGNGEKVAANKKETRYTFKRPGMYKVKLSVAFQGETTELPIEHLWVE